MKVCLLVLLLTLLQVLNGEEISRDYTNADVKRFEAELRRLGVVIPSLVYPGEPKKLAEPAVSSAAGDFEGFWTKSRFGRLIAAFEGIPYAKPPVGLLRFSVAEPSPVLSNFKAKKPGSPCIQRDVYLKSKQIKGNEHCLFLNVYVPEKTQRAETEKLPVIFFIHGGGLLSGRGDRYKSNILLDKDVVLVTFNYRMGPLSFLVTKDGVIPGNLAQKDQVAALRWVHQNIGAFGGNPNLITVMGHSAGAMSSELLMLSPLTKGLIHRVVAMSGSSFGSWALCTPDEMQNLVQKTVRILGCPERPSVALLACLRNKTAEEIALVDFNFPLWGNTPVVPYKPVAEEDVPGAFMPLYPNDLYNADLPVVNDVPYMLGFTSEDGGLFSYDIFKNETMLREFDQDFVKNVPVALYLKSHQKSPEKIESLRRAFFSPGPLTKSSIFQGTRLFTDVYFLWPLSKSALYHRKAAKSPTFVYYNSFENAQTNLKLSPGCSRKNLGVSHADDLFLIFPLPSEIKPTSQDLYLSVIMTELLSSFARDGVPSSNHLESQWDSISKNNTTDLNYLHIKSPLEISMKENLFPERRYLLEKLLWAT